MNRPRDPSRAWPPLDLDALARLEEAAVIDACDFRSSPCNCVEKPARCLLAGWPALVTFDDCRACPEKSGKPGDIPPE